MLWLTFCLSRLLGGAAAYTETCQHRATHPNNLTGPFAQRVAQYERQVHHRMKGLDLVHDLKGVWKPSLNDTNDHNRYVVFKPYELAGLGNRMLGAASAWLFAMLTDRIFLIASEAHHPISGLWCEPILGASWLWPQELGVEWFKGRINADHTVRLNRFYPVPVRMASITIDHEKDTRAYKALVCRGDLREEWWMVQTIVISSNQWFVPLLLSNPAYRQRLQEWFPQGNVFSQLVGYLFHPANGVWEQIQQRIGNLPPFSLGIHLRYFSERPDSLIPTVQHCVSQRALNTSSLYVASMVREHRQQLADLFSGVTTTFETPTRQSFSLEDYQSAVVDVWTLAHADDLVLSPGSTMGYIAQALLGKPAWLLDPTSGTCQRYQSHEPCFHAGIEGIPRNICHGPGWAVRNILREPTVALCQDFTHGWQMQVDYLGETKES